MATRVRKGKAKPKTPERPALKKPENWDIEAGGKLMDRLIDENKEWLKDMAKR